MAVTLYDLVGVGTATTGTTTTVVLGAALDGYSSFSDASVPDAGEVRYLIKDGDNRELGLGTYDDSAGTMARTTPLLSIESGSVGSSRISLSGVAQVYLTVSQADLSELVGFAQAFTLPTSDGTADQVLKTNGSGVLSFADAAGGGGGEKVGISKIVISDDSAIDITLSGYTKYCIRFDRVHPATSATRLYMRTSTDGGTSFDSGASDYAWTYGIIYANGGGINASEDITDSEIQLLDSASTDAGAHFSGEIYIIPADGIYHTWVGQGYFSIMETSARTFATLPSGRRIDATAVDAVRFFMSSGNLVSGEIHVFGIEDAA